MWCGTQILLLWAFPIHNSIVCLIIRYIIRLAIVFTVNSIIQLPLLVNRICCIENIFRWTVFIAFDWMMVESSDSADTYNVSSTSREILPRHPWWHRGSFDRSNAAAPAGWKCDQHALTISSVSKIYPAADVDFIWKLHYIVLAHRFWLPCQISTKLCTLPIQRRILSAAFWFITDLCSLFIVPNSVLKSASIPQTAQANSPTMTFW